MPQILGRNSTRSNLRTLLLGSFLATILVGIFSFTVGIINSSESRLFPEGTRIHYGFPWRNGDHMYYVSEALQISGVPYQEALEETTSEFADWPGKPEDLNLGYLSMDFAPLVYPRFTLPLLLSWGYHLAGFSGMFAVPVIIFLICISLLTNWVNRNFGKLTAVATFFASLSSVLFLKYGAGLFVESIVLLIEVSWLYLLPIYKSPLSRLTSISLFNLSVVFLSITRQMPILPIAVLSAGYLISVYKSRSLRNEWRAFAASGTLVTLGMYLLVAKWAPYNPLPYLVSLYGAPSGVEIIPWSANHLIYSLAVTANNLSTKDPAMFILIPLAILGGWKIRSHYLPWIALSTWSASAVTILLNVPEYRFWAPGILYSLPLAGIGIVEFLNIVARRLKRSEILFGPHHDPLPHRRWLVLAVIFSSFLSLMTITSFVRYFVSDNARYVTEFLTPADWQDSKSQPLGGRILCFGDDAQLILVPEEGQSIALTGTAKSHFPFPPASKVFTDREEVIKFNDISPYIRKCLNPE